MNADPIGKFEVVESELIAHPHHELKMGIFEGMFICKDFPNAYSFLRHPFLAFISNDKAISIGYLFNFS